MRGRGLYSSEWNPGCTASGFSEGLEFVCEEKHICAVVEVMIVPQGEIVEGIVLAILLNGN